MRTHNDYLRKGVAQKILSHIINVGKERNYHRLSLETGSHESFFPAHKLYRKNGFKTCKPFDNYKEDENSIFMTIFLDE